MVHRLPGCSGFRADVGGFHQSGAGLQLAVSQYGRVTASLPWAVAMEKGYFATRGVKIDEIIAGAGRRHDFRNVLASNLPYGEVATPAALAAARSGLDIVIVNSASSHIGEISLVADPNLASKNGGSRRQEGGLYGAEVYQRSAAAARAQGNRLTAKSSQWQPAASAPVLPRSRPAPIQAPPMIDPTSHWTPQV